MNNKFPFVSIIMPIRNEIDYIDITLNAITKQSYGLENFEVLIADGLSEDGTYDVISYYEKKYDNIKLVLNNEKIVSTGFNRALSLAKGSIITRVDGHCIISDNFIENSVKLLREKNCSCVGGSIQNISEGIIANAINIAQSSKFGVGGVAFREENLIGKFVDTLAFGSYKREIFNKIGGYDQELVKNQDDEFNFRLIQHGEKIWLDPTIKSKYYNRSTYRKLFFQYFHYGFYKIRVFQKRKSFSSVRHLVPSIFVILIIITIILSIYFNKSVYLQSLFIMYSFFGLFFGIIETKRTILKNKILKYIYYPLLVFISFLMLHLSYGAGFIWGLFKFRNSWYNDKIVDDLFMSNI